MREAVPEGCSLTHVHLSHTVHVSLFVCTDFIRAYVSLFVCTDFFCASHTCTSHTVHVSGHLCVCTDFTCAYVLILFVCQY